MSRRTQLTTKYIFQVLAQLSENFIFIYLGLSLFTEKDLEYNPILIIVTVIAVCVARWVAVFPLSKAINWIIKYRARRRGAREVADELPYNYQAMLFWAGLRGAVGVALAALLTGKDTFALKATVLVVVLLTVIIFGGTTANMLEILGIRTGVVEEVDSDDEFDIEAVGGGAYLKRSGMGIGFNPRRGSVMPLDSVNESASGRAAVRGSHRGNGWTSGHRSPKPQRGSRGTPGRDDTERSDLLGQSASATDSEVGSDIDTSDLPPLAPRRRSSPMSPAPWDAEGSAELSEGPVRPLTETGTPATGGITATAAIRQLFTAEDPSALLRQLDESYLKPMILLSGESGPST
jgi:solute carrier family 9 (sodium/hydrogen exchanger), member 6/7